MSVDKGGAMYHIAICDDDSMFIEYIKRLFNDLCQTIQFYEYLSGEDLIQDMPKQEKLDLLILDVAFPGMDGNEIARRFREQFPDTVLVFCSGVCTPTVETFETTPYRFWLKQYSESKMCSEIKNVLEKLAKTKILPYVIAKNGNQLVKLSPEQIYYISIAKKGTIIHCGSEKEQYTSSKKLAAFYEQLKDFDFEYAHNSYIVNLKYVAIVDSKELELANGEKLTISRARAKEFRKAFAYGLSKKFDIEGC